MTAKLNTADKFCFLHYNIMFLSWRKLLQKEKTQLPPLSSAGLHFQIYSSVRLSLMFTDADFCRRYIYVFIAVTLLFSSTVYPEAHKVKDGSFLSLYQPINRLSAFSCPKLSFSYWSLESAIGRPESLVLWS